ncbi:MAG: TCR/Tet family MFS transporter [Candidatus Pacebacteria bacterium]|nr:TCR/Tet family MFS transporter [Candidatus Paceibacterota bacterium]
MASPQETQTPVLTERKLKAAVIFVVITVALDILSVALIIPVLPNLIASFAGGISNGALILGLFTGSWGMMQFIFSPILGSLSDRFGRRPVILLSNLGLGLDYILMALAPNLWVLFIGRLLSGITTSTFAVANSYIADVLPVEKRAQGFGMLGAAFGIGFVLGPALGGFLGGHDPRLPFWVAAGLSLTNFLYGLFILPESLPKSLRSPFKLRSAQPFESMAWLWRSRPLRMIASFQFIYFVVHGVFAVWVLYVGYRYNWGVTMVGGLLTMVGVGAAIVQGGIAGLCVRKFGAGRSMILGIVFGATAFLMMGFATSGWVFAVAIIPLSLWGLARPAAQALASARVGPEEQGRLQGSLASITSIGNVVGPVFFTMIFAQTVAPRGDVPGMAMWVAAVLLLVGLWPAWEFRRVRI